MRVEFDLAGSRLQYQPSHRIIGQRTAAAPATAGTHSQPLHVSIAELSIMMQVCRAVRVLGVTVLVVDLLCVVMEESDMMRGMGINT